MCSWIIRCVMLATLVVMVAGIPVRAQDAGTQKAIVEMFQVIGLMKMIDQMANVAGEESVRQMKQNHSNLSARASSIIKEEVTTVFRENAPKLMALVAPIYAKYFSKKEIEELTVFYSTTAGQKTINVLPRLFQEMMILSDKWAQGILPDIEERIKQRLHEEGIKL